MRVVTAGILVVMVLVMTSAASAQPLPDTIDVQKCLAELGYDPGPIGQLWPGQAFVDALSLWIRETFGLRASTVGPVEINNVLFHQCAPVKPMV
jgi:hypothetical protein